MERLLTFEGLKTADSKKNPTKNPRFCRPGPARKGGRPYLVEVLARGPHLLPGFVQQLDADAEELLEGAVVREEHGVEVVAVFAG